jgi:hypothetical protein
VPRFASALWLSQLRVASSYGDFRAAKRERHYIKGAYMISYEALQLLADVIAAKQEL